MYTHIYIYIHTDGIDYNFMGYFIVVGEGASWWEWGALEMLDGEKGDK